MQNVMSEVIQEALCSSCGFCAGLCPSGVLSMEVQEIGTRDRNCYTQLKQENQIYLTLKSKGQMQPYVRTEMK